MEEFQINPNTIILTAFVSLITLCSIYRIFLKSTTKRKAPPSPSKLPIIGNLHQLSPLPHKDLHTMARKHGPLMLLHLGSVPVLIVSSADSAREITRTHDLVFANRPANKASKKLIYDCKDVSFSPYGEYWRQMKSILVLQVLSNKRVQSFRSIREEETALFIKKVLESSGPVDLSAMFANFTNDGIGRAAFGRKYSESQNGKKFLRAMADLMELLGVINIGDFIPWLDWINRLNGFDKRLDQTAKEMDEVFESVILERQQTRPSKNRDDFIDILLEIYNEKSVDRDSVKSLLLNRTGIGMILQGEQGDFVAAKVLTLPGCVGVEEGEAIGIHEALSCVKQRGLENVEFHSDSRVVVDAIASHKKDNSEFGGIIDRCRCALHASPSFRVRYVHREANVMAHKLARLAKNFLTSYVWDEPPIYVEGLLRPPCVCQ